MIQRLIGSRPGDRFNANRINREPSPLLAVGLPWVSVMLLSMVSFSPIIASAPVLPPLSFMALIAWRLLRPYMLPVWAGAPLGAFDDLYSGQPFGSAILLWSLAMILIEIVDIRIRYRNFLQDWLVAAAIFAAYLFLTALIALGAQGAFALHTVLPQIVLTILVYPAMTGLVALLDRLRLSRVRTAGG